MKSLTLNLNVQTRSHLILKTGSGTELVLKTESDQITRIRIRNSTCDYRSDYSIISQNSVFLFVIYSEKIFITKHRETMFQDDFCVTVSEAQVGATVLMDLCRYTCACALKIPSYSLYQMCCPTKTRKFCDIDRISRI